MIHTNRFIAFFCVAASVFATSCVNEFEEEQAPVSGEGYYISLTGDVNKGGVESRAHWDIKDDDKQSLAFTWDQSTDEMKSFVWRSNAFVDFEGGQKYSPTTVTPTDTKNQAQLQITTSLSQAYAQNDVIWAVSPLDESESNISADNKVTFTLPDQFVQTELNSTEHLKQYVLMSGTGKVGSDNTASISFKVLPAIYRFKITNTGRDELTVNEVSISGSFCDKAELSMGNDGTVTPTYSVSNSTYAIKVTTPEGGLKIAAKTTAYLYALVFPTNTASIEDEIELSFKGKYGEVSAGYTKTAKCSDIYTSTNLNSNTYYDMEVPVVQVTTVWDGTPVNLGWEEDESQRLHILSEWFTGGVKQGDKITLHFNLTGDGDHMVKIFGGESWVNLKEINDIYNTNDDTTARDVTGMSSLTFEVQESYLPYFEGTNAFHIIGTGVQLYKITCTHQ